MTDDAFDASARIVRLGYAFTGPDYVGERLEARGRVLRTEETDAGRAAHVVLELHNAMQDRVTTTGTAIVLLGTPAFADAPWDALPDAWRLDASVEPADDAAPAAMRERQRVIHRDFGAAAPAAG